MELSKKELIAMQEMMNFVSPTTKEEALLKKSIYDKISAVVGTPESRKAEQEKAAGAAVDPLWDRCLRAGWMMRIKQFGKQESATILERKGVKYGKQ